MKEDAMKLETLSSLLKEKEELEEKKEDLEKKKLSGREVFDGEPDIDIWKKIRDIDDSISKTDGAIKKGESTIKIQNSGDGKKIFVFLLAFISLILMLNGFTGLKYGKKYKIITVNNGYFESYGKKAYDSFVFGDKNYMLGFAGLCVFLPCVATLVINGKKAKKENTQVNSDIEKLKKERDELFVKKTELEEQKVLSIAKREEEFNNEQDKKINDLNNQIEEIENKIIIINDRIEQLRDVLDERYWDRITVLKDLIISGRADSIKEAINIMISDDKTEEMFKNGYASNVNMSFMQNPMLKISDSDSAGDNTSFNNVAPVFNDYSYNMMFDYKTEYGSVQNTSLGEYGSIINRNASAGWQYVSMNTFTKTEKAGCFNKDTISVQYYVIVFRKPR